MVAVINADGQRPKKDVLMYIQSGRSIHLVNVPLVTSVITTHHYHYQQNHRTHFRCLQSRNVSLSQVRDNFAKKNRGS